MKLKSTYDDYFLRAVKRFDSDVSGQRTKAFEMFKELEKVGHVGSIKYLGKCYFEGIGCERKNDKARDYYLLSIALGCYKADPGPSSYEVLRMIDDEIMDAIDVVENARPSDEGKNISCEDMYSAYVNTVIYGSQKTLAWYRLGNMYYDGIFVEQNKKWAIYFYRRAFTTGGMERYYEADNALRLGKCFYYGDGIGKDPVLAKYFLRHAGHILWRYPEDDATALCTSLLDSLGKLDNTYLFDGKDYMEEDDYIEDTASEWLYHIPEYI
ncbi:tetratricopeptide repeat protein [Butyrivibrio sp. INlla16]|uniref:tetratricopeptide repeat protein n=1 Tax=Butyrivibrio sp. INlla16 TaxID=1520807 RepID=UPI00088D65D4|nr:SEL1-like repeat protein [Butyrivibrio sp. INlla16]SDB14069.1 Sel1 repeat-containing protein [Butyrivibrio sp. INlla16]